MDGSHEVDKYFMMLQTVVKTEKYNTQMFSPTKVTVTECLKRTTFLYQWTYNRYEVRIRTFYVETVTNDKTVINVGTFPFVSPRTRSGHVPR